MFINIYTQRNLGTINSVGLVLLGGKCKVRDNSWVRNMKWADTLLIPQVRV